MIVITVPLMTGRGLNDRTHWAVRAKHNKTERGLVIWAFYRFAMSGGSFPEGPFEVRLVRVFKKPQRMLDDDNWISAAKGTRDQVAAELHVNDGNRAQIQFSYNQEEGPSALIRIEIATRNSEKMASHA